MIKKMKWGGMLVASLLMASGCQNEEIIETPSAGGQRISLTVGREGGSRTALEGDQAVWSKGDKIYVSSKDGKTTGVLTLQGEGGDATGTFSGFVFGNPANLAYSVYPAPTNGTTIDLANILASGQLNAPMIGTINQSADVDVQFRNQCGILYINMNGSEGENFQITANDIDIAADNAETVNVLQFAGTFDVKNISWASDGTPSLIFDNPTSFINVKNTNVAGSNSSVMYVPYYITTTNVILDKVTFMAGGTPMNDEPIDFAGAENGFVGSVAKNSINELKSIAKIGDVVYASLQGAVNAVEDGGTITLVANETFTEANRTHNSGTWYDGMYYIGDKSFTIDLNGKTISHDGAVNDYLLNFKNDGSKDNTITLKNGTLDAGTTAFCALATSSSNAQKITINLEDINLINNNSNGAVLKIRGGAELNVNSGTKIIGKDSYLGIENSNAIVNIYDGAEIYMNGTSSYNGCLVGVGGNGTTNVYGGYGKGVSGGLIAMTSGGTINVSGGEWIANTDGTYANSNKSVLIAQSDKSTYPGASNAVVNVTGGTFKGGYNCYGNAVGDAQINISGGNFNAKPSNYVVEGCYALEYETGVYTIQAFDAASRTFTINSKEELLNLNTLNEKWAEFFSNGQGTTYSDYATQNGGKGVDFYYKWDWTIKLNIDIDFNNETFDAPINLTNWGTFDGQSHTIKNVNIETATNVATAAGLFKASKYGKIQNLKLYDVHVKGSFVDDSTAGILVSDCNSKIDNITITDSSVIGGKYTGGIVGYGYVDVTNCNLTNCTVKGGYKFGGVVGYICASDGTGIVNGHTLTDCTIEFAGTYADGKSEFIIGKVVGNFNCDGECKNNTVTNMTTTATANIGKIEAGKEVAEE